ARLARNHSVAEVVSIDSACTGEGWVRIKELAAETKPNRVLIGACMPYAYIPKLKELGRAIGLSPTLMDVVDIYTPTFPGQIEDSSAVARQVYTSLAMALARLEGRDPIPPPVTVNVARSALVVGGGLAGMTAAAAIADHGYEVCLVEEQGELGGGAMRLTSTLEGNDPKRLMEDLVEQMHKHPNIRVLTDARVAFSRGTAGKFMSAMATDDGPRTFEHGVTILATGGSEGPVYDFGLRVQKTVMTQLELEERIASGALEVGRLSGVAMIQCWRSRDEERAYCSRVCCSQAIKNILALKERNPDLPVYVFYRDIMTYGFKEQYYTQARKAGAIFIRYDLGDKPQVSFEHDKPVITARDPVLNRQVRVKVDILALSSGLVPGEVEDIKEIFGVPTNVDGFFQEAESKWRPLDFLKQGIYTCGLAHSPMDLRETIASAQAAASRALRILNAETIQRESVVAEVRHSLCSLCQRCVSACPYGARTVNMEEERIEVDEILCQGCGSCAAVCPNSATVLRGFHDAPMMAAIDAALEEL
ncbi:MAG: FAD-dependent oxidoreductase, partial [Proteobacteria bacterium]|nr:FAD-dependent oxidoreductase [Pseudomonadota bacterium]